MKCLVCSYDKFLVISKHVRDSDKHKVIRCKKCCHAQLNPIPDNMGDFYDKDLQDKNINYFGTIVDQQRKSLADTVRRVDFVKKHISKKARILEIGSGFGFFVDALHKDGYDITGLEISAERRNRARGKELLNIDLNLGNQNLGYFDLVLMFHVLEHIADPIDFLNKVRRLLRPGGMLIVEVPNYNDFQLRLNKAYRYFYWQLAHIHYFTPKILGTVLKKSGFNPTIIGIQRYSIQNMFNWKLTGTPEIDNPSYSLPKFLQWIEKPYKTKLEKDLNSDTLLAVAKQNPEPTPEQKS